MSGTLFVVATPIGNLEDVTARALRVLAEAAVIAAEDTRRTAHLLTRYAITTPTISLHEHNEHAKTTAILARLERGENVALVSDAGTPTISDPGRLLIRAAAEAGFRVEPIPGPSAVTAALAASGFPSDSFTFLGFPPDRGKDRKSWFERVRGLSGTIVFYEAPHRIQRTLSEFQETVGDREAVVCREMTKLNEELVRGPISLAFKRLSSELGEFTIVVDLGVYEAADATLVPTDAELLAEFGEITETGMLERREALKSLSAKHRIQPNEIYRAIERAKKLV